MTLPPIKKIRTSLLEFLGEEPKRFHSLDECDKELANRFSLTEEQKNEVHGGIRKEKKFRKRVISTISEFRIANLLEDETKPGDASFRISKSGVELLQDKYPEITNKILRKYGEYTSADLKNDEKTDDDTSEELVHDYDEEYRTQVELDLIERIKKIVSNEGFEKLCLKLFEKMYDVEVQHTGSPGDRGVDGILSDKKLGVIKFYVQAKHYASNAIVSYSDVASFYGKCSHDKVFGIFVTTSNFSNNTRDEFEREDTFVKLVDGKTLAKWLYEYNIGIKEIDRIILKEIDDDGLSSFN